MANLETAIRIAVTAHAGQTEKSGRPYITHPLRLMASVDSDDAKIIALLHDVVEDTTVTLEDLHREGFSPTVLSAIDLLTHRKVEPYADYVVRIKPNALAKQVKLADLTDNTRIDRCLLRVGSLDHDFARIHRYLLTYQFLTDRLDEPNYRASMVRFGDPH